MVTNYKRPIITQGNDFYLNITMSQFVDNAVEDFDLSKAKSVEVYLICASHNRKIDLDFEIIDTPEHNVIKAFVDHRRLHTTSYGICVEGDYENDMHFKWYALPKEALLIVPNTSGQYIPGPVEYIDLAGRVGFGEDLSDYYTKEEIDAALEDLVDEETLENGLATKQDVLVSGENIRTVNNISLLGSGNIEIGGGGTTANADWNCSDPNDPAYIFNKPVIPAPQVQADWDETNPSSMAYIRNKPDIEGEHDYSKDYLTFTALNDILFSIGSDYGNILQYSLDNGQTWLSLSQGSYLELQSGTNIMCKMSSPNLPEYASNGVINFNITGECNVSGNIMSLLYGDDFDDKTDLTGKHNVFTCLFQFCYNIISAEHLILPATTLAPYCYIYMFNNCASMTTAPKLPATTLADGCYGGMFLTCASLTTAPELPATTLAGWCYEFMFQNCTSLTNAPKLPATTLEGGCYGAMFKGCTSLTVAPELPATTLKESCYNNMFLGCTSLTTAPELPVTTLADECYSYMFYGCTSLTTAPELPATTLADECYYCMFEGCSSLNYIKCLATDISAHACTLNWVSDVATTGTFIKDDSMNDWTTGISGIPSGWTSYTESEYELVHKYELDDKQDTLVSGTNIKTINSQSLLGSGNIEIGGGGTQVNADWTETDPSAASYIQHKPDLSQYATQSDIANFVEASDLATVATSGSYNDLSNKPTIPAAQVNSDWNSNSGVSQILPTIPAAQVNSDWNSNSGVSQILNKPDLSNYATQSDIANFVEASDLATVATSGSYNDLSNKPTIPAAQVNSDWNSNSGVSQILNKPDLSNYATQSDLSSKQDTLVSGTNIKTINSQSLLGSGDITISGGNPGFIQVQNGNKVGLVSALATNYDTNIGDCAVIEGIGYSAALKIVASGDYSHAEGQGTKATGGQSHAEGLRTTASSIYSHAEGTTTTASGNASHAEGSATNAIGNYSHTEGYRTKANNQYEHAEGTLNISNNASGNEGDAGNTLSSIGNGAFVSGLGYLYHNAFEIKQNGDIYYADTEKIDGSTVHYYDAPMRKLQDAMVTSTTAGVKIEVVSAMPATPDSNTLYLVV